jgi:hypothetical protein
MITAGEPGSEHEFNPCIAVDFDGTLCRYAGREYIDFDPCKAGEPVELNVARVKAWLAQGEEIVIFTARMNPVYSEEERTKSKKCIDDFCMENFGRIFEVTCEKHPRFKFMLDDKSVRVVRDTGEISDGTDFDDPLAIESSADAIGSFLE